ncbi:MAG: flagellar hook basal-body protein [Candidatus Sericytochromatia bacterium]|nr:flagellar hook basal-body protein [Candidatus Sericytochromatia bacterium]
MRIVVTVIAGLLLSACTTDAARGIAGPDCTVNDPKTPAPFILGSLTTTGNLYDWALDGPGYFQVRDPKSEKVYFTRRGAFKLTAAGTIVTRDDAGLPIEPQVTIPSDGNAFLPAQITPDGVVIAPRRPGDTNKDYVATSPYPSVAPKMIAIGQIHVVVFPDPSALTPGPNGLLRAPDGTCPAFSWPGRLLMYAAPGDPAPPWDATGSLITGTLEVAASVAPSPAPSR